MKKSKCLKPFLSMLIVMILTFSLIVPAYAMDPDWFLRVSAFPTQRKGSQNNSNSVALVGIIQKTMYCYSDETRAYIVNSGGVDGTYGQGTSNAVAAFQQDLSIGIDGDCGPQTWPKIAVRMNNTSSTSGEYFSSNTYCAYSGISTMLAVESGSIIRYYYMNAAGRPSTDYFAGTA